MNIWRFIWNTFLHYFGRNVLVALGVAVSAAVLTGALIIGDSVNHSLEQATLLRLGNITHAVTVTDRYFRSDLARELQQETGFRTAPALMFEGMAVADGGRLRLNKVQVTGVDNSFTVITGMELAEDLTENEVIISENMAQRLEVQTGDALLVRIAKASLIPKNAPFVSDNESTVAIRVTIKGIATREQMGHFNLKNSQSSPYNLFISIDRLNRLMEFEGRSNRLLISAPGVLADTIYDALSRRILPADGGLSLRTVAATGESEIISERVFMENSVVTAFSDIPGARPILTYFVNSLRAGDNQTPYSFVASMPGTGLAESEILLNDWTAADLQAKPGDSLRMTYFEIGPLRQLTEKEVTLVIKDIVPMKGQWADGDLMPHLPGLSDAGHCREWEAGVPIQLDNIRQKDEDYWEKYKGIPKAFVSTELAGKLWANRFGNYTAIRLPAGSVEEDTFSRLFGSKLTPAGLGFAIQAVRDDGLQAARGGVNFSELFLGLSFFLLLSAIILSTLMFRLNLENRGSQTGTLLHLGFSRRQVFIAILSEALLVAGAGIIAGLVLAVAYTRVVFSFLNTLWWDIVRTDVLFIQVKPITLLAGGIISLLVVFAAILIPARGFLKQRIVELHRTENTGASSRITALKKWGARLLPAAALLLLAWQLLDGQSQNPAVFFIDGGLLLPWLLLLAERRINQGKATADPVLNLQGLSLRNLSRNRGRSLTVIILFALGTFLVVSTGANRQDMFSGAAKKTSGSGGFHHFAETSVPVLYDLNDASRRATEGLPENFTAVQFHRVEGDDASCLNLNRISNPAILGVDPAMLEGRFSFATRTGELDPGNPWSSLEKSLSDGVVPAIADQTVIQWGLGMKVGDTLMYQNETGDTLKLRLIGGLTPSLFQGYVIIANRHFLKHFPTHSGSSVFLLEGDRENPDETASELQMMLRDYGWEMMSAPKRLAEFYSVTNTYLSIFLALGALGLALGTIGLALVLARSVIERKRELAVLQAVGFRRKSITAMLVQEYGRLLAAGVSIGFITAIVATLPSLLSSNVDVSISTIALVVALILVNGFVWIYLLARVMIKPASLMDALRDE